VNLALDDFGTGYSSLSHLKRFPIDTLKIDQSFVRDLATDADDASIVSAVISMGESLHIRVVAEGVETREQLTFLQEHSCRRGKGTISVVLSLPGNLRDCWGATRRKPTARKGSLTSRLLLTPQKLRTSLIVPKRSDRSADSASERDQARRAANALMRSTSWLVCACQSLYVRYSTYLSRQMLYTRTIVSSSEWIRLMSDSQYLPHNHLLAVLSLGERNRLFPHLQLVAMPLGHVLCGPGDLLRHAYFPIDCTVSLLSVMENGESAEISVVGNDGVVGVALFMGGETTPSRAVVQSAGHAYRLDSQRLKDEFHRHGGLQVSLLALHAGSHHSDVADCGLQPASLGGPTAMSMAALIFGLPAFEPIGHDPGPHRPNTRHRASRRHRCH